MTWREAIQKTAAFLESKNVPEAQTAGELLAARLLNTQRGFLAGSLDRTVLPAHIEALRRAMARLVKKEPIQYVLGEWDFRYLTLKCDRRALIPRPETEELVTRVLKFLNGKKLEKPFVVDVGTGTGAIILSLASEYKGEAVFLGIDISPAAIELAKENARRISLPRDVSFVVADGLDDFDEPSCVDVIVSNPPYIKTDVCKTLDASVKDFEPINALDGGPEGLDFYDRYLSDAINLLKPGGAVFFEIGYDQGSALEKMMFEYGFSDIRIEKDFAGNDRYASCVL
jgi:release factor glutamine methyltransferase